MYTLFEIFVQRNSRIRWVSFLMVVVMDAAERFSNLREALFVRWM